MPRLTASPAPPASQHSSPGRFPTRRHAILLLAGLALMLGAGLGSRGLNEPDEGRYATIALGFLQPGADAWEPRFSGYAHYDKPPLIYWVTALSLRTFGRSELAARLPSFASALVTLLALGWAVRRLRGPETAWWSVLICGTFLQFTVLSRFLTPDMLLTAWCTLGVAAWAEARHRHGHWGFWALSLLCWTLGWWTKAAAAGVPLLGLAAGLWVTGDRRGLQALRPMRLAAGAFLLGLPWFVVMMVEHPETVRFFLEREAVGRIAGHVDGRRGPIYYYLLLSLGLWAPWLPVLSVLALARRRVLAAARSWTERFRALGMEGILVGTGLVVFSLMSSKLPAYTLPLAPWAAVSMARLLLKLRGTISQRAFRRTVVGCVAMSAATLAVAAVVVPRIEGSLGANASVRELAARLGQLGARSVYIDRHLSGLEFYFGEQVTYVRNPPRQRSSDDGVCAALGRSHFVAPSEWPREMAALGGTQVWVIHDRRSAGSPFLEPGDAPPVSADSSGQFVFWRIR